MSCSECETTVSECFREGIDMKWATFGILACIFGSLQSYLQAVGRLLRGCPERHFVDQVRYLRQQHCVAMGRSGLASELERRLAG